MIWSISRVTIPSSDELLSLVGRSRSAGCEGAAAESSGRTGPLRYFVEGIWSERIQSLSRAGCLDDNGSQLPAAFERSRPASMHTCRLLDTGRVGLRACGV